MNETESNFAESNDGNMNLTTLTHNNSEVEEDWDLASPLLLQLDQEGSSSIPPEGSSTSRQEGLGGQANCDEIEDEEDWEEEFVSSINPKEFYTSLLASIFVMTFIILVVGSYFFQWSDTVLRVQGHTVIAKRNELVTYKFSMGQQVSFDLPLYTDATFQSTLRIFQSSKSNLIVFLIISSSVVAPILYMIIESTLLCIPRTKILLDNKTIGQTLSILRFGMKFSMTLIFVNSILNICTSNIKLIIGGNYGPYNGQDGHFNNENPMYAFVVNNARGGLISYLIGLSFFGIGALHLIGIYWGNHLRLPKDEYCVQGLNHDLHLTKASSNDDAIALALNKDNGTVFSSPPPSAFRQHDIFNQSHSATFKHEENNLDKPLLEEHDMNSNYERLNDDISTTNTPVEGSSEDHMNPLSLLYNTTREIDVENSEQKKITILNIILFESGLFSFLFLLPVSTLPLIKLEYSGLLTTLLDPRTVENSSLTLMDITRLIVSSNNDGRDLFGLISIAFFWINVIIIPITTWALSSCIWFFSIAVRKENNDVKARIFGVMKKFQPFSFMTPFAISLFVTVSSLQQVTDFLFNQNGACQTMRNFLNIGEEMDTCMNISGHLLPGGYILLLQALFNDIFVALLNSISK